MREHRGEESEKGSAVRAATEEAERNRCRSEGRIAAGRKTTTTTTIVQT